MTPIRYRSGGRWFKGNTHIHSTRSDGGRTFAQLERMYASKGYDFLFRTDHWCASDVAADPAAKGSRKICWMDGIELDGSDGQGGFYHIVGLGRFSGIDTGRGLVAGLGALKDQGGVTILAHPLWMGCTFEDTVRWRFDGVEVYNHVCHWLNGKGSGLAHWHHLLAHRPGTLGFAVDDAHITEAHPGWNGGWIMVQAETCAPAPILDAIRAGCFFSSCGPSFLDIAVQGRQVAVRTTPVRFARLVGPRWAGDRCGAFRGPLLAEAEFAIPPDWPYAYVEIEDGRGRRAWTNSLV